jgi:hypothetical protein
MAGAASQSANVPKLGFLPGRARKNVGFSHFVA